MKLMGIQVAKWYNSQGCYDGLTVLILVGSKVQKKLMIMEINIWFPPRLDKLPCLRQERGIFFGTPPTPAGQHRMLHTVFGLWITRTTAVGSQHSISTGHSEYTARWCDPQPRWQQLCLWWTSIFTSCSIYNEVMAMGSETISFSQTFISTTCGWCGLISISQWAKSGYRWWLLGFWRLERFGIHESWYLTMGHGQRFKRDHWQLLYYGHLFGKLCSWGIPQTENGRYSSNFRCIEDFEGESWDQCCCGCLYLYWRNFPNLSCSPIFGFGVCHWCHGQTQYDALGNARGGNCQLWGSPFNWPMVQILGVSAVV